MAIGENVGKEVKHVTEVLKANGYAVHVIRSAQEHRKRQKEEEKPKYRISLPYVPVLSEDLKTNSQKILHQDSLHNNLHSQEASHQGSGYRGLIAVVGRGILVKPKECWEPVSRSTSQQPEGETKNLP